MDPRIENLLVYAAWHPERGYDVTNINEIEEDVTGRLGSKAMDEGWEARLTWLTLDPFSKTEAEHS